MEKIKAKTAVGRFLDQIPESFNEQLVLDNTNKTLSADKNGDSLIFELPSKRKVKFIAKLVDTKKCRVWIGNIRHQEFLDDKNTEKLKEKIKAQGQLVPVLARPIKNDPQFTHEIIYGSRRHYVCTSLGINIKILEVDLDDSDAILFMDAENAGREDVSPFELAMAYKNWLDVGIYKSQGELSEKLGITRSWLNKTLSLTRIPLEIIIALSGPKALSLNQGLELVRILTSSEKNVQALIKDIKLNKPKLTFEQIVQNLSGANEERNKVSENLSTEESYSKTLYTKEGNPVCKITNSKQGKSILTFNSKVSKSKIVELIDEIENLIKNML